jgi:[ribosomal protein S5]-alanine N-acetyltransferase
MKYPTLSTDRLVMRQPRLSDTAHFVHLMTDKDLNKYIDNSAPSIETVMDFLRRQSTDNTDHSSDFTFSLELKNTDNLIGMIRVMQKNDHKAETGFVLKTEFQRNGYMTEAMHSILYYFFTSLNIHRIYATCDVRNTESKLLLERIGMTQEGLMRDDVRLTDGWRSSYLYAILSNDFNR